MYLLYKIAHADFPLKGMSTLVIVRSRNGFHILFSEANDEGHLKISAVQYKHNTRHADTLYWSVLGSRLRRSSQFLIKRFLGHEWKQCFLDFFLFNSSKYFNTSKWHALLNCFTECFSTSHLTPAIASYFLSSRIFNSAKPKKFLIVFLATLASRNASADGLSACLLLMDKCACI